MASSNDLPKTDLQHLPSGRATAKRKWQAIHGY